MVAYFWVERTISLVSRESVCDVILKALLAGSFANVQPKVQPEICHQVWYIRNIIRSCAWTADIRDTSHLS